MSELLKTFASVYAQSRYQSLLQRVDQGKTGCVACGAVFPASDSHRCLSCGADLRLHGRIDGDVLITTAREEVPA